MIVVLRYIGRHTLMFLESLGQAHGFLVAVTMRISHVLHRPKLLLQQIYELGVLSLANVLMAGLFVGMVLSLQGHYYLANYGVDGSLGVFVASTLARELGPVVAALLFAGRVGSSLAAELALMKTTEQLNALEMMAVEPLQRIVAPRILASMLVLPLLTAVFIAMGIAGAYLVAIFILHLDGGAFWVSMRDQLGFYSDIATGLAKAFVFAFVIGWVSLFQGYVTRAGAIGMAKATTRSVVISSLVVLGLDFLLTAFMYSEH